jgi:hypothetical protein
MSLQPPTLSVAVSVTATLRFHMGRLVAGVVSPIANDLDEAGKEWISGSIEVEGLGNDILESGFRYRQMNGGCLLPQV